MGDGSIADRIARVLERIAAAAARAGRDADSVRLVAVTKTVEPARIAEAVAAGARDFGENYVQESLTKIGQSPLDRDDLRWHLIGHLQRNKAKEAARRFALVQSVDSVALALELGKRAQQLGRELPVLLEVRLDTASEAKTGLPPEATLDAAAQIAEIPGLRLQGLMGMAPFSDAPENARPHFRRLRALFERLPPAARQTLSMGMTNDFEIAVEEGATLTRIGAAIFGRRD